MSAPGSIPALILGLFWPDDAITQAAILLLLTLASVVALIVYVPLLTRLFQIGQLQHAVQACFDEESSNAIQRQEVGNAFAESPLAYQWGDFVRRWQNAIAADPIQNASLPELSRAPVRLMDVLGEHPLVPAGARRSMLPALPAIFLSAGLVGAFAGLVLALPGIGLSLDPPTYDAANRSRQIAALMEHLGMALRIGLWGLMLSLGAAITGRFIEGRADALAETLDSWVQLAYGAISTGELTTRTAHEHRASLARMQEDLGELLRHASGRPRPLIRSTAPVPGAGSTGGEAIDPAVVERSLEAAGTRLIEQLLERSSAQLNETLERSVAEQLAALRESLGGAFENLSSEPAAQGELTAAVDQLARSSETQNTASRSLTQTAHTVSDASEELRAGLDEFADVVTQMREATTALALAAKRGNSAATPERADSSLQLARLEDRLAALGGQLASLSDRIEAPAEASEPAATAEKTAESLPDPVEPPAAEVPEDEPVEPEAQEAEPGPSKPRPTVHEEQPPVDEQPEEQDEREPSPPEQPEMPPMTSEADTVPNMPAPSPEMIYAARAPEDRPESSQESVAEGAGDGASGNLSGLLRATHHSGPSSRIPDPDDFDPAATLVLEQAGDRQATERLPVPDVEAEPHSDEDDENSEAGSESGRESGRRGFFSRRK